MTYDASEKTLYKSTTYDVVKIQQKKCKKVMEKSRLKSTTYDAGSVNH